MSQCHLVSAHTFLSKRLDCSTDNGNLQAIGEHTENCAVLHIVVHNQLHLYSNAHRITTRDNFIDTCQRTAGDFHLSDVNDPLNDPQLSGVETGSLEGHLFMNA
jgi:hypothetical protein